MPQLERLEHQVLGYLVGAGLDHHDRIGRAGHAQIKRAGRHLRHSRVDHERAVDEADAHRANRAFPCDIGDHHCRAGAEYAEGIQLDFGITRQGGHDDLHLVDHSFREQRAQRAVDQAGDQDGQIAGPALPALKTAGNTPGGIETFLVIDAEREEIHPLAWLGARRRGQDDGIARAHGNGAAGKLGQRAGFNRDIGLSDMCRVTILLHLELPVPLSCASAGAQTAPRRCAHAFCTILRSGTGEWIQTPLLGPLPNSCASGRHPIRGKRPIQR